MSKSNQILYDLKKPIPIEDVDFRIQSISLSGWATILSYKNARIDANRLDDVCGVNWQNDFKMIDGKMYGGVGIKIEDEWMWRWDVGTESNMDKEKGQASDAFKRACFKWGIGRELYNYPLILVQLNEDEFTIKEYQGKKKATQTNKLRIKDWLWSATFGDDGIPVALSAKDQNGNLRFSFPKKASIQNSASPPPPKAHPPVEIQKTEKPWLNVLDAKKDMSREWAAVIKAIREKRVINLSQVTAHYNVSVENRTKLTELLKSQTHE